MSVHVSLEGLTKSYVSGGAETRVVDGVSLEIEAGELFFLLGPSGCGKTTLLRMIAGFVEPSAGRILFDGDDITYHKPNKRNIGMMFQSYALWPHMTVAENLAFGLEQRGIGREERGRLVGEALKLVRMGDFAGRKPTQLSGGQQQRVALARALVIRPRVLLLDEPLSNLDTKLRVELRSEIRRVCKAAGVTGVYVTHDQREALAMADRMAVMGRGVVEQVGEPREVYARPRTRFVAGFMGEVNLYEGEVVDRTGGTVGVKTGFGVLRATGGGEPSETGEVVVAVRPESWRLGGGGVNEFEGRVEARVFQGETETCHVQLPGGASATVVAPARETARLGEGAVRVSVDPSEVVILSR